MKQLHLTKEQSRGLFQLRLDAREVQLAEDAFDRLGKLATLQQRLRNRRRRRRRHIANAWRGGPWSTTAALLARRARRKR